MEVLTYSFALEFVPTRVLLGTLATYLSVNLLKPFIKDQRITPLVSVLAGIIIGLLINLAFGIEDNIFKTFLYGAGMGVLATYGYEVIKEILIKKFKGGK